MIRLIASDMDGTLLDEHSCVPNETFELIEALCDKGVRFAVSSGRQYDVLCEMFAPVYDKMDFVASNGAQVFADGQPLGREVFSYAAVQDLFKACEMFDCLHLALFDRNEAYLLDDPRAFIESGDKSLLHQQRLFDPPEPDVNVIKASVFCDMPEYMMDMIFALSRELEGRLTFAPSGGNWIDVTPIGVSKATGLRQLLRYLGIPAAEVMAFGDAMNDYDILRFVGYPRVMGNGLYGVKQIAGKVIGTNEEHAVQKEMRVLLESLT